MENKKQPNNTYLKRINNLLDQIKTQKQEIEFKINQFKDSETEIDLKIDEDFNNAVANCFDLVSQTSDEINNHWDQIFTKHQDIINAHISEKNSLSLLKYTVDSCLSHKWRERLAKQANETKEILESIKSYDDKNEQMGQSLSSLIDENKKMKSDLEASQKIAENTTNRFMTIFALLVSLMAIIFSNIVKFSNSVITWESVVILNTSILIATCVVYMIIENVHLAPLRVFSDEPACKKISRHQITFNVVLSFILFVLVTILVVALICSNMNQTTIDSKPTGPLDTSSSPLSSSEALLLLRKNI